MRKLAVTLALATTALSTPALARDDAWYVGVEGGAMLVEDIKFDVGTACSAAHRGCLVWSKLSHGRFTV